MIAASAIAPPAALAVEQDREHEGTAPAAQTEGTSPETATAFEPGGENTSLPAIPGTTPQTPGPAEEQAPAAGASGEQIDAVVDAGDGLGGTPAPAAPSPAAPPATAPPGEGAGSPPPTETAPPVATPANPPAARAVPPQPPALPTSDMQEAREPDGVEPDDGARPSSKKDARQPAAVSTPPVVQRTAPQATEPATAFPVAAKRSSPARPGDRSHTVQPGESLWAIASDLLGPDATPAQIARKVHHLWQLNDDRIGTGDPDLLMIGTELTLR